MGFRFRKSIKMGPVRVNFSKSGVGYSVGVKGARVTKKATGGTRTTLSVPGTGISHVTETSGRKASPAPTVAKPQEVCAHCGHPVGKGNRRCPSCNERIIRRKAPLDIKSILCGLLLVGIVICAVALGAK